MEIQNLINEILEYFKDINFVYNDCMRFDTLKRMLDELVQEVQEGMKDGEKNNILRQM